MLTQATVAHPHRSAVASEIAPAGCSPAMRDRSEEAATPGLPATLSRFGKPQQITLGRLLQNQPCAIPGSVSLTPAVIALSNISKSSAIRNRRGAVRNLWTTKLGCGSLRKTQEKFYCRPPESSCGYYCASVVTFAIEQGPAEK